MAEKKQEKKKDGAQGKRVRPQGWHEGRRTSRSVRRLAHVLRHCGEDAARSFAAKNMLEGPLNSMLRSPEYQQFRLAQARRRLTYPERRAQKRRLAVEQTAAATTGVEAEASGSVLAEIGAMIEARPEKKPVSRGRRRTTAAKLKSKPVAKAQSKAKVKPRAKATARPKVIAVRGRVRKPDPKKAEKAKRG